MDVILLIWNIKSVFIDLHKAFYEGLREGYSMFWKGGGTIASYTLLLDGMEEGLSRS